MDESRKGPRCPSQPQPAFFSPETVGSGVKIGHPDGNFLFSHMHSSSGLGPALTGCMTLSDSYLFGPQFSRERRDGMMAEFPGRILGKITFVNVCNMPGVDLMGAEGGVSCSCCPDGLSVPAFVCSGNVRGAVWGPCTAATTSCCLVHAGSLFGLRSPGFQPWVGQQLCLWPFSLEAGGPHTWGEK